MGRPDQVIYRSLLRCAARFAANGLPLVGVAGTDLVASDLRWAAAARRCLEAPPPGAGLAGTQGARVLHALEAQLGVLLQAEEHTREALAQWAALASRFSALLQQPSSGASSAAALACGPPCSLPFAAAAAAEEGLALLTQQAQQLADPLQLELEASHEQQQESKPGVEGAQAGPPSLDDLAALVRRQHPELFPSSGGGGGGTDLNSSSSSASGSSNSGGGGGSNDASLRVRQARALADVLYRQQRFKHEPFEWVYEGLQPLLLPPRLGRRKLAPITLAALAAGVGRRLGLPLLPVPAEPGDEIAAAVAEGPAGGAAAQALPLQQLRPDVAQRYAGRASAAPPASGPWVLLLGGDGAEPGQQPAQEQQQQQQEEHIMDARTGELLDPAAAVQGFPALRLGPDWAQRAPLVGWQHMVRTIIQAHQRRGESDLVAHWVYVLLALDPQAEEWGHMLQGGGA